MPYGNSLEGNAFFSSFQLVLLSLIALGNLDLIKSKKIVSKVFI